MMCFYNLTFDTKCREQLTVVNVDFASYDYTSLWEGKSCSPLPISAQLTVTGEPSDLVANPYSLTIVSERFLDLIGDSGRRDLQIFDAPLVSVGGTQVTGYYVVNCIRRISCLDRKRAKYHFDEDEPDEFVVLELRVNPALVPPEVAIFRVDECPYRGLIFRESAVTPLVNQGLRGVAFIRC